MVKFSKIFFLVLVVCLLVWFSFLFQKSEVKVLENKKQNLSVDFAGEYKNTELKYNVLLAKVKNIIDDNEYRDVDSIPQSQISRAEFLLDLETKLTKDLAEINMNDLTTYSNNIIEHDIRFTIEEKDYIESLKNSR